jgi:hypothetical protein
VTWREVYESDLQGVLGVSIVPALFLVHLAVTKRRDPRIGVLPRAAAFVRGYALLFAIETILDPISGGPLMRALGLADGPVPTIVMVAFVLLGDFRVFLLVLALAAYGRAEATGAARAPGLLRLAAEAALWTLPVPVVAVAVEAVLRALRDDVPAQSIWLVYELAFLVMALGMRQVLVPSRVPAEQPRLRDYLRTVLAYVATYYALWATADVAIMIGGLDAGWGLRIVPNQLYYAFWIPVVYGLFFSRRYASTSRSVHASR